MTNKRKNFGIVIVLVMLIGLVPWNTLSAAGEYEGYNNSKAYTSMQLYIKQTGQAANPAVDQVVYCYNAHQAIPNQPVYMDDEDWTIYSKHTKNSGTAESFQIV